MVTRTGGEYLHQRRVVVRGGGVGGGRHGGPEVVVAGAEAPMRQHRGIGDDMYAHCETPFHAAEAGAVWRARNAADMLVAPAGDSFDAAKTLDGVCEQQGVLSNVGEERARHVQA
jgi:hypothetical protein